MLRFEYNSNVYVVEEPTLRQNNAFLKVLADSNIQMNVDADFDLGQFLVKTVDENVVARLLQCVISLENGKYWSVDQIPLTLVESMTDSQIEQAFKIFFEKKKSWINLLKSSVEKVAVHLVQKHFLTNKLEEMKSET